MSGAGRQTTLREQAAILLLVGLIWLLSRSPLWCGGYLLARGHIAVAQAFSALGLALMLVCPLLARRWLPRLAGFDMPFLPGKKRHFLAVIPLLLAVIISGAALGYLGIVLGLRGSGSYFRFVTFLPRGLNLILIEGVLFVLLGPLAEEVFWRGYALRQFEKVMPRAAALAVQAVLFSCSHFRYPLWFWVQLLPMGLLLGLWRQRFKSILPLIIVHAAVNGIVQVPSLWSSYQYEQWHQSLPSDMKEMTQGVLARLDETACTDEGREIWRLGNEPADRGIPSIIPYLGHENDDVSTFAFVVLVHRYGRSGASYYADALRSDNDRIVEQTLTIIGYTRCTELIPDVREVIANSTSTRVQLAAVLVLVDLEDREGLEAIAASHPNDKVRNTARWGIRQLQPPAASQSQPATLPAS